MKSSLSTRRFIASPAIAPPRARANRVTAALRLARIGNGLIAALGVLAGAWWAAHRFDRRVAVVMLAAVALATAANAWNDASDVDIDRVAHPDRPLVTGDLSIAAARRIAVASLVIGTILAAFADWRLAPLSLVVGVVMFAYSPWVKRVGLAGNAVVAILASMPFLYGAIAGGRLRLGITLLIVAAPLHFAREIAKDIDDRDGDATHRATLPIAHLTLARWTSALAAAIFCVAFVALLGRDVHPLLLLVPAIALTIFGAARVVTDRPRAPTLYKFAMLCAMLALFAA